MKREPKLFGWESIAEIRSEFIEDYNGRVDEQIAREFDRDMRGLLVAERDGSGYEESAHFLLMRGRQLHEVEASHCSCNGFDGQWDPQPVEWEQLAKRPARWFAAYGDDAAGDYVDALVKRRVARRQRPAPSPERADG